jgi:hypothetical protein
VTGGADKEFFSFAATDLTTPDLINNHTESSGWSYAIHDSSCNAGGAYIYSPTWRDNFVAHPILVDGCDNVLSIGTKGGSSTNAFTAAGTSIVYSLFDTMWSGRTTTPWTTSGSGKVYLWSQVGKFIASTFAATSTSSNFSVVPPSDTLSQLDFDITSPLATQGAVFRIFRLTNTSGSRNFIIFKGDGTGTANFQVDASNGNTTVAGSLTIGGGSAITSSSTVTRTIASGTATMTTASIAAGACGSTVTVAATGVATTDSISFAYNAAVGANPGVLIINKWPTSGNVNFNYCNPTAASVTPSAATLNWRVTR